MRFVAELHLLFSLVLAKSNRIQERNSSFTQWKQNEKLTYLQKCRLKTNSSGVSGEMIITKSTGTAERRLGKRTKTKGQHPGFQRGPPP